MRKKKDIRKQRLNYVNRIFKEFGGNQKLWEIATEGKSWETIISNKRTYERFKYKVKVARERPKIEKELEIIKRKRTIRNEYQKRKKAYNELRETFTDETAKQIVNNKDTMERLSQLGMNNAKNLIEEEFRNRFEQQDKALFKFHYEEPGVQPVLEQIYRLAREDKDSYNNLMRLQEDMYKEVVYQKYEEFFGKYGETYQADEEWFQSVAEEMLRRYKKMIRR